MSQADCVATTLSVGKVKQKVINAFVEIFFKNFRLYRQWRNCMSEATSDIICWHEMNMNNRIISVILQKGFFLLILSYS